MGGAAGIHGSDTYDVSNSESSYPALHLVQVVQSTEEKDLQLLGMQYVLVLTTDAV